MLNAAAVDVPVSPVHHVTSPWRDLRVTCRPLELLGAGTRFWFLTVDVIVSPFSRVEVMGSWPSAAEPDADLGATEEEGEEPQDTGGRGKERLVWRAA